MSNQIAISGHIGNAAEVKNLQNGTIIQFNLADKINKESTAWYNCTSYQERHVKLEQYLKKGTKVTVYGNLLPKEKDKMYYLNVRIGDIDIHFDGKDKSTSAVDNASPSQQAYQQYQAPVDLDDTIPF